MSACALLGLVFAACSDGAGPSLTKLELSPATATLAASTSRQLVATAIYSDGTTKDVSKEAIWSSSSDAVATVSTAGLVAAKTAGTATIKASFSGMDATAVITVSAAQLTSIEVTPTGPSIAAGTTQQFVATGVFSDSTTQDLSTQVTWTSADTTVAEIDSAGLATGKSAGTSTITAAMTGVSGTTDLTVTAATLTKIEVTPSDPSIARGTTQQFKATGVFSDTTTQDITTQVTWASSNESIATVSDASADKGLATAVAQGTTTIKASLSGVDGMTLLTVTDATLVSIAVTPATPSIAKGTKQQFVATATYSDTTTQDVSAQVTWASSDGAIATISNATADKGLASALALGTTTIKASLSGLDGTATLTVTDATLVSIAVTPAAPSIAKGTKQQFVATATYSDSTTQDISAQVTWASSDGAIATISNATADKGLASALAQGTTTITASLSGIDGSTTLTVTDATLVSIAVTPATPSIAKGTTQQFVATGTYSDSTTQDLSAQVTWASSDGAIATISNATADKGLAAAVAQGTTTITASLSGIDGSTALTVTDATLVSIAVTPGTPSLAKGTTLQFAATATYTDSSTQDVTAQVTWASSDGAIATISNATADKGLASAVAQGTTTITASLAGQSGTATLTVTAATLVSIAVTPSTPSIAKGTTQQFAATATYSDSSNQDVTTLVAWSSSATSVATISNATGSQGLASGASQGSATITATLSGQSGTATLAVTAATLTSIAVTPAAPSVAKGSQQQFVATGTYSDSSTQTITTQVSWSSSATSVATISNAAGSRGLASTLTQGSTTITATLSGQSGTALLTVSAASLVSIAVTPTTPSIANGTTIQFSATATYTDSTTQNVTDQVNWGSTTGAATISNAAGSRGLASAASPGTTTITATLSGTTGSTVLSVTSATLSSITITPSNPSLPKGATVQFTATGNFSDSTTQNITALATWSSSNTAVATVSSAAGSKGFGNAISPGSATIQASFMGKNGTTPIAVTPASLVSIAVTPAGPSIAKGSTIQFTATGTYSDSTTLDLTTTVSWASSASNVASISNAAGSEGLASGINQGSTTIGATLGGVTGTTTLQVTAATLVAIAVTPTNPTTAKGTTLQFTATGTYSDSSTQNITSTVAWSTSDPSVATVSNAAGSRGLASGVAQGPATITATLSGHSGATLLTVTAATLSSIAITPAAPVAAKGTTVQFTATGTYSDSTTQDLTAVASWGSVNENIATVALGLAQAVNQGSTTISASYGGKNGTAVITVTPASLVSITVTPTNPSIAKGTKQQFIATGNFSDSSNQDISNQVLWSSSNTGVATISNAAGSAGLASSNAVGSTTITASLSGKTGNTALDVTAATLSSIAITPVNPAIAKGTTQPFVATGTYSDASTQNITALVTWSSSDNAIATVSNALGSQGLANGISQGNVIITATLGGKTGTTLLTVSAATLVSIAVTPIDPSIAKGTTQQFAATGTYSDSSTQDLTTVVTWSSSNTTVATISNVAGSQGLALGGGQGQTVIAATLQGLTDSSNLTVTAAILTSITVTPANPSIGVAATQQFVARGFYSDATSQIITTQVTWSTVDSGVATISNAAGSQGLATGVASGQTNVEATMSGVTGATQLTVAP